MAATAAAAARGAGPAPPRVAPFPHHSPPAARRRPGSRPVREGPRARAGERGRWGAPGTGGAERRPRPDTCCLCSRRAARSCRASPGPGRARAPRAPRGPLHRGRGPSSQPCQETRLRVGSRGAFTEAAMRTLDGDGPVGFGAFRSKASFSSNQARRGGSRISGAERWAARPSPRPHTPDRHRGGGGLP